MPKRFSLLSSWRTYSPLKRMFLKDVFVRDKNQHFSSPAESYPNCARTQTLSYVSTDYVLSDRAKGRLCTATLGPSLPRAECASATAPSATPCATQSNFSPHRRMLSLEKMSTNLRCLQIHAGISAGRVESQSTQIKYQSSVVSPLTEQTIHHYLVTNRGHK